MDSGWSDSDYVLDGEGDQQAALSEYAASVIGAQLHEDDAEDSMDDEDEAATTQIASAFRKRSTFSRHHSTSNNFDHSLGKKFCI